LIPGSPINSGFIKKNSEQFVLTDFVNHIPRCTSTLPEHQPDAFCPSQEREITPFFKQFTDALTTKIKTPLFRS